MYKKIILSLFFILLLSSGTVFAQGRLEDSLALVELFDSAGGHNWTDTTNWNNGPIDTWYGVIVTGTRVTALYLGGNNLVGTIPPSIGDLDSLEVLFLNDNELTGSIPPEIGNLTSLEFLRLKGNQLTGPVPPEIGNLTSLEYLHLNINQLTDSIPPEIGSLTDLVELLLSNNQLVGSIPPEIGNLTSLEDLALYYNQLTGSIPPEIGGLTSLTHLLLYNNQLTGPIPPEIGDLKNLTTLSLNNNQLTDSIPSAIGAIANLEYLNLSSNQLAGSIPPDICLLNSLENLRLNDNQLTGSIPTDIGDLTSLTYLVLNNNQLTGSIPSAIVSVTLLQQLYFNDNDLVDLPSLSALSSLERLYIQNNRFTFEDIEPNLGVVSDPSNFVYSPQDSVGEALDTIVNQGSSLTISVSVGGEYNLYQWKKDGMIIPGAEDSVYTMDPVGSGDDGLYICEVANDSATDLTLYSRPITVSSVSAVPEAGLPKIYSMTVVKRIIRDNRLEVKYGLPEEAKVKFSIYDIRGAKVSELSEENPAGNYSVKINMSSKPAGVYFFRMEANDRKFTATGKILLM